MNNVFKLLAMLTLNSSDYEKKLDDAEKKGSSLGGKLTSAFGKMSGGVAKGIGVAVTAVSAGVATAGAGVAKLATSATQAFANYEQLVGGVETLFGAGGLSIEAYAESMGKSVEEVKDKYESLTNAQSTVLEKAKNAYKTAGLSANEYMETVTSFSASLISSLGGDTEKASEVADMAITDMSDNANKMGSSMESIQNAYNGFAKQNYTMLDNLNTMGALVA